MDWGRLQHKVYPEFCFNWEAEPWPQWATAYQLCAPISHLLRLLWPVCLNPHHPRQYQKKKEDIEDAKNSHKILNHNTTYFILCYCSVVFLNLSYSTKTVQFSCKWVSNIKSETLGICYNTGVIKDISVIHGVSLASSPVSQGLGTQGNKTNIRVWNGAHIVT